VRDRLRQMSDPIEVILPSRPPQDAPYSWDLRPYLENNAALAGVDVTGCSPATLQVRVDKQVQFTIPVVAPSDVPGLVQAVPSQDTVKIVGPSGLLGNGKNLAATMDLLNNPILNQPGTHVDVAVRLIPPVQDDEVKLTPDMIMATLKVGEADVVQQVPNCTVGVYANADILNGIENLSYPETLPTLQTFKGPKAAVAALLLNSPNGMIRLDQKDVVAGGGVTVVSKTVSFPDLPPGVKYVPPPDGPPVVQVRITPKSQ
jgi:hypothetical protein